MTRKEFIELSTGIIGGLGIPSVFGDFAKAAETEGGNGVLYSYHRLIRRIEDKEKVRLCSMILLERYVNPNVQGG